MAELLKQVKKLATGELFSKVFQRPPCMTLWNDQSKRNSVFLKSAEISNRRYGKHDLRIRWHEAIRSLVNIGLQGGKKEIPTVPEYHMRTLRM